MVGASTLGISAAMIPAWNAMVAGTVLSAATGVLGSIQQSRNAAAQAKAQSNQAHYQAQVAKQNQQLAQEQASAQRRQGYEEMLNTRRKAAALIGSQRAAAGASGLALYGSIDDVADQTAMDYESAALAGYNEWLDKGRNTEYEAWNYGSQAAGYKMQEQAYNSQVGAARSAGLYGALGSAAGGIASIGSTWAGYAAKAPQGGGGDKGINGLTARDFFKDYPDFA